MFSATRHILESITRDPVTERVRSIKPDEQVESMWDGLDKTARAYSVSPADGVEMGEGFEASYIYTEADEIEDALLFPLEATGEMADNLFRNDPSAMELFEKETIDVRRFAADLDTDEEPDEDFDADLDDSELDEEALAALEDDDGDSDWGTDEEEYNDGQNSVTLEEQKAVNQTVDMLAAQMKKAKKFEPDYFLPIARNPASATNIPDVVKNDPELTMRALRYALRCQQEYATSDMAMEADFFRHIDRQKSKGMYSFSSELVEVLD
jgi:hypothetical protein